ARGALEFQGVWHSWGERRAAMGAVEALLAGAGLGEGAPVGVSLRHRPGMFAALLQLLASKRCVVPINPVTSSEKIAGDLHNLRVAAVIADTQDWAITDIRDATAAIGALGIAVQSLPAMSV